MQRTALQRKTPLKAKTGFKRKTKLQLRAKKVKKRAKLPSIKTMRNKCDALLTPIIKKLYPRCLLTGMDTEVAHHHVHKSKSNALRYYIPNLIPLTHKAHQALHHNESYYASMILRLKGLEWFEDIERVKNTTVKTDIYWYMEHYKRLKEILDS